VYFKQVELENWRNFLSVDVELQRRAFIVGPTKCFRQVQTGKVKPFGSKPGRSRWRRRTYRTGRRTCVLYMALSIISLLSV